tara:strand:- start:299 stop:655 length:357 start_codon:yes stop_codon:yes gene_type:complete
MIKLSFESIDRTMIKAASIIRAQNAEINRLKEIIDSRSRFDHAEKIASVAVERGLMGLDEAKDYASDLAQSEKDLGIVEDFVTRTAAGTPLSSGIKKVANDNGEIDILTSFLLTNDLP